MVLSNAERQARHRQRLKEAARDGYEIDVLKKQVAMLERVVNQLCAKNDLPGVQLPKSAYKPHR